MDQNVQNFTPEKNPVSNTNEILQKSSTNRCYLFVCFSFIRVRVKERISSPPGHVISQGVAPRARVVTCRGGGGHKSLIGAGVSKF